MKTPFICLAALGLMTTACTSTPPIRDIPIVGNVCTVAEGTLIDEKAVLGAQVLYNVPAHAYRTADEKGQLTPAVKAAAKSKLITMYSLLQSVKAARGTVNCDYNEMLKLHAEVTALLPRSN